MDLPTAGATLRQIARLHLQLQRTSVACCDGTTQTECVLLTEVGRLAPATLADLSRQTGLDKSWVSRAVEALVKDGLLDKQPGVADQRTIQITLTPAGEIRLAELHGVLNGLAAQVLAHIPADKHALVAEALALLEQAHQAVLLEPIPPEGVCAAGC
ncbi:MAG TPA: MarR family winged helix-turn-helix transcriptional regulator [Herpetosiphonaceae bacterium]